MTNDDRPYGPWHDAHARCGAGRHRANAVAQFEHEALARNAAAVGLHECVAKHLDLDGIGHGRQLCATGLRGRAR